MTTLTPQQRQQVERAGDEPVRLDDPDRAYLILKAEVYERMRAALEDRQDARERRAFLEASHESAVTWMRENPY